DTVRVKGVIEAYYPKRISFIVTNHDFGENCIKDARKIGIILCKVDDLVSNIKNEQEKFKYKNHTKTTLNFLLLKEETKHETDKETNYAKFNKKSFSTRAI
ncbi:45015_t:CDS:1, partial [Gigaspora margarita]